MASLTAKSSTSSSIRLGDIIATREYRPVVTAIVSNNHCVSISRARRARRRQIKYPHFNKVLAVESTAGKRYVRRGGKMPRACRRKLARGVMSGGAWGAGNLCAASSLSIGAYSQRYLSLTFGNSRTCNQSRALRPTKVAQFIDLWKRRREAFSARNQ